MPARISIFSSGGKSSKYLVYYRSALVVVLLPSALLCLLRDLHDFRLFILVGIRQFQYHVQSLPKWYRPILGEHQYCEYLDDVGVFSCRLSWRTFEPHGGYLKFDRHQRGYIVPLPTVLFADLDGAGQLETICEAGFEPLQILCTPQRSLKISENSYTGMKHQLVGYDFASGDVSSLPPLSIGVQDPQRWCRAPAMM